MTIVEPNLYELIGKKTQISYITDPPQLHYRGPGVQSNHDRIFSGDEAALRQSEIGRLVTVTLESAPDLHMVTLAVFVPPFNLQGTIGGIENSFETLAILTTHRISIGGPNLVHGAVEIYRVLELKGMAHRVEQYIVVPRSGTSSNELLELLNLVTGRPDVSVERIVGDRSNPRRLVILATPEAISELQLQFEDQLTFERDARLELL